MKIVVWLAEGTWTSCVDAAVQLVPAGAEIVLLHVTDPAIAENVHGAYAGLLGRGGHDPGDLVETQAYTAENALLELAAARLGRPAQRVAAHGRAEREVVAACAQAALLILARDGDHSRLGPRSLGAATRFVVDHAPCRVLLIWPDEPPSVETIPPPP